MINYCIISVDVALYSIIPMSFCCAPLQLFMNIVCVCVIFINCCSHACIYAIYNMLYLNIKTYVLYCRQILILKHLIEYNCGHACSMFIWICVVIRVEKRHQQFIASSSSAATITINQSINTIIISIYSIYMCVRASSSYKKRCLLAMLCVFFKQQYLQQTDRHWWRQSLTQDTY